MFKVFSVMVTAVVLAGLMTAATAEDKEAKKPKKTIKEVMKEAHGSKLHEKVIKKDASKEEREQLLDLYVALAENKPPMGDDKSWTILTARLVSGASYAIDDPEDVKDLQRAVKCGVCHGKHKPKKKD